MLFCVHCVFCRIGSLEKCVMRGFLFLQVFCRIGSLERCTATRRPSCSVFCRIGSLEMADRGQRRDDRVFCRIGSLEKRRRWQESPAGVFCRVGSLEIQPCKKHGAFKVFCRIGSLETNRQGIRLLRACFLPHRQLRTCSQSVRGRKQRGLGWAARPACGLRLTVHPGSRSCAPHGQIMNKF